MSSRRTITPDCPERLPSKIQQWFRVFMSRFATFGFIIPPISEDSMKRLWLIAAVICLWSTLPVAQSHQELVNDGKNPENVLTQSMGYDRKNFSPLSQINKSNVRRLVPVWSTSLMNDAGELASPTIYNGVMYVINGRWTFAIDVATGNQLWRTPVDADPAVTRVSLFGAITRGAATIYNGKLFRISIDNHLLALDMKTGTVL